MKDRNGTYTTVGDRIIYRPIGSCNEEALRDAGLYGVVIEIENGRPLIHLPESSHNRGSRFTWRSTGSCIERVRNGPRHRQLTYNFG